MVTRPLGPGKAGVHQLLDRCCRDSSRAAVLRLPGDAAARTQMQSRAGARGRTAGRRWRIAAM
jgi:hypothetical protein